MTMKFIRVVLCFCFLLYGTLLWANDSAIVRFDINTLQLNVTHQALTIKAIVSPDVKLYGLQRSGNDVLFSSISFDSTSTKYLDGVVQEKGAKQTEKDLSVDASVSYYSDSVLWQQALLLNTSDSFLLKGNINYFYKKGEQYVPGEHPFKIHITAQRPETGNAAITATNNVADKPLWWIFLTAFAGGLLALLTPCVYSMIPVTVSFFTKRSKTRKQGIRNALYYSSSIVVIFTLLGFFMALTLAVVSFSCTGPIIGNLLVLAAKGSYWGPLTGMFGFSLALALPFALFAFFPSKLNMLGKAGGWLNAVKVTLGFLELALALKFLSNADLAKGWRILDREVFIAAWIVIFVLLGIYLLGKLKFHHDDELPKNDFDQPYLSVKRLLFAMASLIFAVYMIPGLWGAPLKGISAFVPPMGTQDFNASPVSSSNSIYGIASPQQDGPPHPEKYYDQMKIYEPEVVTKYGMVTYFDYKEALEVARKLKKPLMLDFTGINCVNCRKMEGQVWSDPEVMKRLKENFVIASLYVDIHKIELLQSEHYFSKVLDKEVETLGDKNADLQVTKFGANTQPYYFFLDANENRLMEEGYGYDPHIQKFINLLDKAKQEYKNRKE